MALTRTSSWCPADRRARGWARVPDPLCQRVPQRQFLRMLDSLLLGGLPLGRVALVVLEAEHLRRLGGGASRLQQLPELLPPCGELREETFRSSVAHNIRPTRGRRRLLATRMTRRTAMRLAGGPPKTGSEIGQRTTRRSKWTSAGRW